MSEGILVSDGESAIGSDQRPRARPLRADAERNRKRILAVAREALDAEGDISLHAVAQAAGVGQGTLYRHFPNREALIMAVHRTDVLELVGAASALLAEHAPAVAMQRWFEQLARYGRLKHGLADVLHTTKRAELAEEGYGPVVGAIAHFLEAGVRDGSLRGDVAADEVLILVGFLWRIDLDEGWEERVMRMLGVVMDALRAPGR